MRSKSHMLKVSGEVSWAVYTAPKSALPSARRATSREIAGVSDRVETRGGVERLRLDTGGVSRGSVGRDTVTRGTAAGLRRPVPGEMTGGDEVSSQDGASRDTAVEVPRPVIDETSD